VGRERASVGGVRGGAVWAGLILAVGGESDEEEGGGEGHD